MKTNEIKVRCRAINGIMDDYRVMVDDDGTVRVWDSVAGYYTTCHGLGDSAQRRIRKLWAAR
jgi:hypothetical protein